MSLPLFLDLKEVISALADVLEVDSISWRQARGSLRSGSTMIHDQSVSGKLPAGYWPLKHPEDEQQGAIDRRTTTLLELALWIAPFGIVRIVDSRRKHKMCRFWIEKQ
jgi:hypothetical protein